MIDSILDVQLHVFDILRWNSDRQYTSEPWEPVPTTTATEYQYTTGCHQSATQCFSQYQQCNNHIICKTQKTN